MRNKRSGKTSYASHNKYNAKAYDRFSLFMPKGQKDVVKAEADKQGQSLNGYINQAIAERMERDKEQI